MAEKERREIEEIDWALRKIEEGVYGRCERCRRPISPERLEALPEARLCQSCLRRSETAVGSPNPDDMEAITCSAAPHKGDPSQADKPTGDG